MYDFKIGERVYFKQKLGRSNIITKSGVVDSIAGDYVFMQTDNNEIFKVFKYNIKINKNQS